MDFNRACSVYIIAGAPVGLAAIALNQITPNQLRGQVIAIHLFVVNLGGYGFGPLSVALFTDYVFQDPMKLNYSIACIAAIVVPAALLRFYAGLKPYRALLDA